QTSYSSSWSGGEAGSFNWQSNLNGIFEKQFSPLFSYKGTLRLSFGQTHTQDAESGKWNRPQKSTDLIDWENVGRFTLNQFADPYLAFRLETQFYDGSNALKKLYLSPMRLTESAGLSRQFYKEKEDHLTARLGIGLRQTLKTVISDPITLATVDSTLVDGGIESVTDAVISIHKNLRYTGKLTLFRALFFSESSQTEGTEFESNWKAIDLNFENALAVSVSRLFTVNLYVQLIYDKEVIDKGRFKETLAIGLTYKVW
ncbi:MAG: DUF3078 domain-containing protein, partial [candidate division Zixibacteria bacterium]